MTIEEALLELGLFQTPQPPPDNLMYWRMRMEPGTCEHDVPLLNPCFSCRANERGAA